MSLREDILQLLRDAGPGLMMSTVYDTAWVARLGTIDKEMSDAALDWICKQQLPDGSWGAEDQDHYHDRVICTLSAMLALAQRGRRAKDQRQIVNGEMALKKLAEGVVENLEKDSHNITIGFEMIVPTLLAEAQSLGIIQNEYENILHRLSRQREAKLAILKGRTINRLQTIAFSAEIAGADGAQMFDIDNLQESNGAVAFSPSATAYFALHLRPQDPRALAYIRGAINKDGGWPNVSPFEVFERCWILYDLALLNDLDEETLALCKPHIEFLLAAWTPGVGVHWAADYEAEDGDDTFVAFKVLAQYGYSDSVDIAAVFSHEEEKNFRSFANEADPSVSANVHALEALHYGGLGTDHPSVQKILTYLRNSRVDGEFWFDKWHASPYYATTHAIIALVGYHDELAYPAIDWILKTQNINGSWGYSSPSAEETAYCLRVLVLWRLSGKPVSTHSIKQAANWLMDHMEARYPALWIGKCLYCPEVVVRSTILTALALAEKI